ncbi:Nucleoside-diphosphate-sugar pyrophosphorylase family protein [uncultured Woeseiaceae bacterium]|uniref:Nucleoside-diphosphate-sugar pyrophosphorylase family protein n=1 Tax=uncultured Woeseiaceae bacterium TaxID=1983305 RepID=A0A7D9D1X3_9GAMM|nr:Nucleoside-diphosphate-sugar pyrophosphorylase family protein [uncultured Woeseiaceae bacterium]
MNQHCRKAVILAGGKGTRLRPFSFTIPKPLMPIGEDPILLRLLNQFKMSGVEEFFIALGFQAELVKAYFGDGQKFGVKIKYYQEDFPLGTAGPLSLMASEFKENEYFFLANGDIYTELDFGLFRDFAIKSNSDMTVGCVEKKEKSSFGVIETDNGEITGIIEKPERTYSISSGMYVLNGRAVSKIPCNRFFTIPDLMNVYLSKRLSISAFMISEFWMGIENAENLDEVLNRTILIANSDQI